MTPTLQKKISNKVLEKLEEHLVPWQKPWKGWGYGVGTPRNVYTKQKYFGINLILLNIASKENNFRSSWWGTIEQFAALGGKVSNLNGTEILLYKEDVSSNIFKASPIVVYNYDQVSKIADLEPKFNLTPNYSFIDKVLKSIPAKITPNRDCEAWYYYPPDDFITIPSKEYFESGLGGKPGYYEALAHELCHWSEVRLGFDIYCKSTIKELRAEICSSLVLQDFGCPHSIAYSNIEKWRDGWIWLMRNNPSVIFKVAAEACDAADYISSFSMQVEPRFNKAA